MALDTLVSQITYRARLMERALHDAGPWTMVFATGEIKMAASAAKVLMDDGISLHAHFPGLPSGTGEVTLYLRENPVAVFPVDSSEHGFTVEWALRGWVTNESRQH